ncbi:MAG TPA: hypothetical protein VF976_06670, partial [Gemmatimonadales bacterium]
KRDEEEARTHLQEGRYRHDCQIDLRIRVADPPRLEIAHIKFDVTSRLGTAALVGNRQVKASLLCTNDYVLVRHNRGHVTIGVVKKSKKESRTSSDSTIGELALDSNGAIGELFRWHKDISHLSLPLSNVTNEPRAVASQRAPAPFVC